MGKLKACPACGKDVAKSAEMCPHCGKNLKSGLFVKLFFGIIVLAFLGDKFGPGEEGKARHEKDVVQQFSSSLDSIANAQPTDISPSGELSQAFTLMSDYTNVQRDNMEEEIKGNIVQWSLPIYEVSKRSKNKYRVQTLASSGNIGTSLTLYTRSPEESAYIERLQIGGIISFKGRITGITMRSIDIDPAVLAIR